MVPRLIRGSPYAPGPKGMGGEGPASVGVNQSVDSPGRTAETLHPEPLPRHKIRPRGVSVHPWVYTRLTRTHRHEHSSVTSTGTHTWTRPNTDSCAHTFTVVGCRGLERRGSHTRHPLRSLEDSGRPVQVSVCLGVGPRPPQFLSPGDRPRGKRLEDERGLGQENKGIEIMTPEPSRYRLHRRLGLFGRIPEHTEGTRDP